MAGLWGTKGNEAQLKQYEKEQQQLLKEIQRQKEANLKKEQNKKKLDERVVVEQMKMMQTITRPRIGVIVMKSEIEERFGFFEHEDLWMAIGKRVIGDSVLKEAKMSAIEDDAKLWRECNEDTDDRQFKMTFRVTGGSTVSDKWPFPANSTMLDAVKIIIKERTTPSDNVLPMDVAGKFVTIVLPHNMKFAKLVDAKRYVAKVNEIRYKINRMVATVRMRSCLSVGAAAPGDDDFDEVAVAASDDNEILVEPAKIGRINAKAELQNGINGDVIFTTNTDVVNNMSVKTLRDIVNKALFADSGPINFEMVLKAGSLLMYDNIASGKPNVLENFNLNKNNVIQVQNAIRPVQDNEAMKGEEARQPKNKYARFCLNLDIDEDSVALRHSQYVMEHDTCWTKTSNVTFRFIEHPENSDYQNRCVTLYDEYSFNMFYEQDSLRTMKRIIAMGLSTYGFRRVRFVLEDR